MAISSRSHQPLLPGMEGEPDAASSDTVDKEGKTGPPARSPLEAEALAPQALTVAPPVGDVDVPDLTGKTVYVVDANSLIFQVFHAIPEMTSPRGMPVSAVFGFTRDIMAMIEQRKPDYLFVAFDRPEPTFRHELFDGYKGERSEMPVDLIPQFPAIHRVLEAMGIPIVEMPGYEADDVLATIAELTACRGGECFLVSGDKDCRQLLSDRVRVLNVRKNQIYGAAELLAEWGVTPEQVVDFQTLVGDAVDNIPGVPLVGPKVASEWLQKFGTLDNLLSHIDELPKGKRRDNLIASRDQLPISRRLARLDRQVPLSLEWDCARVGRFDAPTLQSLFVEFGFHSLAQRVGALPAAQQRTAWEADYRLVDTAEKFERFISELSRQKRFAFDTETTHIWPTWAEIVGYSFSWEPGVAYYLPVLAPEGEPRLDPLATREALRPILENPAIEKIGQNLKYDLIVLRNVGVEVRGASFDTMVASYLLDAGERNHNLDDLSERYLNHVKIKTASLIGSGKSQRRMDEVPVAQIAQYAGEDADAVWRLEPLLAARLQDESLADLNRSVEVPLINVLVELESNGIQIDIDRLTDLSRRFGDRLAALEREIYELAGREFNIGSPKQLQQVLFEEQKLPQIKRTKTGGSTDVEVLEELARLHPLPAKIMEFRQYSKLKSTYVDALPTMVNPRTLRVHSSFNQVVAATGRLSSNDPNLQNIPIRTAEGREIRAAFLPANGDWRLLAADYSQIELRVLAHFSSDPELLQAFADNVDIHASVASQVYGVPLADVTPAMRRGAKAVNFGVIYGQSPFGLAKQLDIDQAEAARFINAYFDRYQGVEAFLNQVLVDCQKTGYVKTILGRRRAISGVRVGAGRQRNLSERTAINTVIQGSAADLIKLAMISIVRRLRASHSPAKMLLQIHDELVFETPESGVDSLAQLVREEMTTVLELATPLVVDVKVGRNWADCEPLPN